MVNIKEYEDIVNNNEGKKETAMIDALKYFDEVWFINPNHEVSDLNILILKRRLELQGISVGERMFHNDSVVNIIRQIPDLENRVFPTAINLHFFVTSDQENAELVKNDNQIKVLNVADPKESDYRKVINEEYEKIMKPEYVDFAIQKLKDNREYLKNKYYAPHRSETDKNDAARRCALIDKCIEEIRKSNKGKGNKITYERFIAKLEKLQEKMITDKMTFSKRFGLLTTAAKNINAIRKDI